MNMMKRVLCIGLIMVLLATLAGCNLVYRDNKFVIFSEKKIVGRTSQEIREKYGFFDYSSKLPEAPGLWRNCCCGYLINEGVRDAFGEPEPPMLFMIYFDENGVAYKCTNEYNPNWGA